MKRAALVGWLLLGCASPAERESGRPNILFLLSDDQRADTISALGNPHIQTPNLDRLVREGTAFTRAVSPNPVCVPSRAEILTGAAGFRNNVWPGPGRGFAPGLSYWPQTLAKAGYHAWYVGKWHSPGTPQSVGYLETDGQFVGTPGPHPRTLDPRGKEITGYGGWMFKTDEGRLLADKGKGLSPRTDPEIADAAVRFLNRRPARPFFLHVNFTAPHDPLLPPPAQRDRYPRLPLPPNFMPEHPFDHGNARGRDELLWPFPRTEDGVREELGLYYAMISHLDAQVGRILAALDATGQAGRTVVVFSSDHGLAIGSHGLRGKQNMYEHTVAVPLVFRGPGVPRGERRHAQVYLRDLFPTTCEMAGVPVPPGLDGRSFLPVLRGEAKKLHPAAFGYFGDSQRMVRTDRWKLISYPKVGKVQLFDLADDPHELKDLSAERAALVADLRERLEAWQRSVGDPLMKD